jgi:predicted transposase YdaD
MARDHEFYELAEALPAAVLALLGLPSSTAYKAESVEIKRSSRRIDLLLRPASPDSTEPIYVVELWRHADPDGDRNLMRKALDVAEQRGVDRERVQAIAVYVSDRERRGVLPAHVGPRRRRSILFVPERLVLRSISPRTLLRRGGAALAALPLVGADEQVRRSAGSWRRRLLRETATLGRTERAQAERLFALLLTDRFTGTRLSELLGEEGVMPLEKTATGQEIFERGEKRGEKRGLARGLKLGLEQGKERAREHTAKALRDALEASTRERFGRCPRSIAAKVKAIDDPERLTALIVGVARATTLAEVVALLE